MFKWLYRLLGRMLAFFESFLGSYALALLLYALVFKIVFLPFSIKQQKNQIALAKLTPKIEMIKAKYKGRTDQPTMQKQQQEIMELQQKEGYNPLSGCLPLLLQLPLIMLLYTVIQNPLSYIAKTTDAIDTYNDAVDAGSLSDENIDDSISLLYSSKLEAKEEISKDDIILNIYRHILLYEGTPQSELPSELPSGTSEINIINKISSYINEDGGIYKDERIEEIEAYGIKYSSIPNFMLFGKLNLAQQPSKGGWLIILPFLVAISQWLTMWLSRKINKTGLQNAPQDGQQKASLMMMDLLMPAMTLFLAFSMPAMLGLYWIFQSFLGLGQTFILSKVMPLPKFTEEDIKAIKKAQKEAEKSQKQAMKNQPKYRSLHYIDDEEYDTLPEAPQSEGTQDTHKSINGDIPEIKD